MPLSDDEAIVVEPIDSSIVVRFVRPGVRNPLSIAVINQLRSIVDDIEQDRAVETLIFTGTSRVFASGADLREIAAVLPDAAREFALRGQMLMTAIESLPQITIAAVNGVCFGGALDLALACDHRVASPDAQFAHPGAGLGIITGWGGTQRLPRLIGESRALEMFFTAEPIDAGRALTLGLVDSIVSDVVDRALEVGPSSVR